MTSLAAIRKNPRVKFVDDERSCGNGIIVTLRRGWSFDALEDNRVAGEDTVAEANKAATVDAPRSRSGAETDQ